MSPIVLFYLQEADASGSGLTASDSQQRTIDFIISQSNEWFEKTHDYIQWLFPLNETSMFNLSAPILTPEDVEEIKNSSVGIDNLIRATFRFVEFLNLYSDHPKWLSINNHNYLRITRMLKCLNIFDLDYLAIIIYNRLHNIFIANQYNNKISMESLNYWFEAVSIREC